MRQLKCHVRERADPDPLRAIAIDDWSWRKGFTYGTIIVDLERRTVADVLETRSAKETADFLDAKRRAGTWKGGKAYSPNSKQLTFARRCRDGNLGVSRSARPVDGNGALAGRSGS